MLSIYHIINDLSTYYNIVQLIIYYIQHDLKHIIHSEALMD